MFDAHAQKNILIVMLQIFDNLFHYKNTVTVQWIKRLKLCMVTMATLPPAKELKIQVVPWQNEIRTLDVLKSPTCMLFWAFVPSPPPPPPVLKNPMKMKLFDLSETELFHFHGIFKKKEMKSAK